MSDIRLEDATINFQGQWLGAEDLKKMVQEKLDAGDMKFAAIAAALEELNTAMENSHTLEERVVVPKETYERLIERGGGDDTVSVHKAVMAYIEADAATPAGSGSDSESGEPDNESSDGNSVIKCMSCKALIEVPSDKRPIVFDCPVCGTSCRLTL